MLPGHAIGQLGFMLLPALCGLDPGTGCGGATAHHTQLAWQSLRAVTDGLFQIWPYHMARALPHACNSPFLLRCVPGNGTAAWSWPLVSQAARQYPASRVHAPVVYPAFQGACSASCISRQTKHLQRRMAVALRSSTKGFAVAAALNITAPRHVGESAVHADEITVCTHTHKQCMLLAAMPKGFRSRRVQSIRASWWAHCFSALLVKRIALAVSISLFFIR